MRRITLLVVACLACAALAACAGSGPTTTVERFAKAMNDRDVNALVECCDSTTASLVKSAIEASDGLLGLARLDVDVDDLIDMLIPEVSKVLNEDGQDVSCAISVKDLQERTDNGKTSVIGTWVIEVNSNGNMQTQDYPLEFLMVQEDGEWKIDFSGLAVQTLSELLGM